MEGCRSEEGTLPTRSAQRIRSAPHSLPQDWRLECFWKGAPASVPRAELSGGGGRADSVLLGLWENSKEECSRVLLDHAGQVQRSHSRAVFLALASALLHY